MNRRLFLASAAAVATLSSVGRAMADDAEVTRKLVGIWHARQQTEVAGELDNLLTLQANGRFAFTSKSMSGPYQNYYEGTWSYANEWIGFVVTRSQPAGLVMAPLQVFEVTETDLRTNLGDATRVG
jgi:hypothetical protein